MTTKFKARFWKIGKWFVLLFIVLFSFRLIYGYVATDSREGSGYIDDFFSGIVNLRRNYASEKIAMKGGDVQAASAMASNQKYEKTASIRVKSSDFDRDEKLLKFKSKSFNAVIQYEQSIGQKGNRQLHLLIGVSPNLFDSLYVELKTIGLLKSTEIVKVDKTNEYRQLNAEKASIEKALQSLNDLKLKGGQIADFVALNDKILEIEEKAQELGVELGNFDTENEFCTIKLSMYEGASVAGVSFMQRIKVALEWTIQYFAFITLAILLISLGIFVILLIIDKLNVIATINRKLNE